MTVATQVKQTLANLKGLEATLNSFASIEENREAKEVLFRNAERISNVIKDVEDRVVVLEYEEPQYKDK